LDRNRISCLAVQALLRGIPGDSPQSTDRQKVVLNRYLDGFEGKLTAKKWTKLTKSQFRPPSGI